MRETRDGTFFDDSEHGFGVCFGHDYAAEHESGIADLRRLLGCENVSKSILDRIVGTTELFGIEKRRIRNLEHVRVYRGADGLVDNLWVWQYQHKWTPQGEYGHKRSMFAWSDRDFGIHVTEKADSVKLTRLYEAMLKNDVAVSCGRVGDVSGLMLTVISTMPAAALKAMEDKDRDAAKLRDAGAATLAKSKIKEHIRAANLDYFAMSPYWKPDHVASAYPVWFWLNPYEQRKYEANYYTVEQLLEWCKGTGPVLKSACSGDWP